MLNIITPLSNSTPVFTHPLFRTPTPLALFLPFLTLDPSCCLRSKYPDYTLPYIKSGYSVVFHSFSAICLSVRARKRKREQCWDTNRTPARTCGSQVPTGSTQDIKGLLNDDIEPAKDAVTLHDRAKTRPLPRPLRNQDASRWPTKWPTFQPHRHPQSHPQHHPFTLAFNAPHYTRPFRKALPLRCREVV